MIYKICDWIWVFLDNLSHSDDMLQLLFVRRRALSNERRALFVHNFKFLTFSWILDKNELENWIGNFTYVAIGHLQNYLLKFIRAVHK